MLQVLLEEVHEAAVMQRQQKEEEMMMAAGLVEMNRDKTRHSVQETALHAKRLSRGESKRLECQKDGEEESGKERQEEGGKDKQEEGGKERQKEGGKEGQDGGEEGRRQDDDGDEKQVGRRKVVRPQFEEDVWKGDEAEKRMRTSEFGRFLQAVQAGSRGATATATRRQR